jgi:YVTN family beta-propeller protein
VAVNETTSKAYVVSRYSNSVTVIDGRRAPRFATVPAGVEPEGIAINAATNRVYVGSP